MHGMILGFSLLVLVSACRKEEAQNDAEQSASEPLQSAEQAPAAEEKPPAKKPAKSEPQVTCDNLGIPSYELWIRELSALRCESCHNERLAFNGIKLLSYEDYQTYAEPAKARIASNMLSKPLDVIEQRIFLDWFNKGMPRTEKDCSK